MTGARDSVGQLLSDAQRLTTLGAILRKLSLDELPELWNVLRGEMSLVGPPSLVGGIPRALHGRADAASRHAPGSNGLGPSARPQPARLGAAIRV